MFDSLTNLGAGRIRKTTGLMDLILFSPLFCDLSSVPFTSLLLFFRCCNLYNNRSLVLFGDQHVTCKNFLSTA